LSGISRRNSLSVAICMFPTFRWTFACTLKLLIPSSFLPPIAFRVPAIISAALSDWPIAGACSASTIPAATTLETTLCIRIIVSCLGFLSGFPV
jgi:hypothetical protein